MSEAWVISREIPEATTMVDTPCRYNRIAIPDDIYFLRLESLELSVRLFTLLHRAGISLIGQLLEMDLEAFHQLPLGAKSREEIIHRIQTFKLLPDKQEGLTETLQEETAATAPGASTVIPLNRRPLQSRFAYCVAVSQIPGRYRERLPRQCRICWLSEPTPMRDDPDTYTVRIAETPAALSQIKMRTAIHLNIHNERQSRELVIFQRLIQDATECPQALTATSIRMAPAPFLPEDSAGICHRPAITMLSNEEMLIPDLFSSNEEAFIPDVFYLEETYITRISPETAEPLQLVNISELPGRLTGHQSGPVYSVWMKEALIAQSPVWDEKSPTWDESFASLDTHDRRIEVVKAVRKQGGTVPTSIPLDTPSKEDVIAITHSSLQEDFQLVPLKDPIFLRKEDVCKEDVAETDDLAALLEKDPVDILEKATYAVEAQHETLVAQMSQRLEQFELAQTAAEQQDLLEQQRNDQRQAERLSILRGWLEETMIWYTNLPDRRKPPIIEITPVLISRKRVPVRDESGKVRRDENGERMFTVDEEWVYLLTVGVPTTLSLPPKMVAQKHVKTIPHAPDPIVYGSKPPVIVPKSVQCAVA